MRTTRTCAVSILATVMLAGSAQVFARMEPSILMIYGQTLQKPVFLVAGKSATRPNLLDAPYLNLWAARSFPVLPAHLTERPYFNVAMFWGVRLSDDALQSLKPEQAHQQGRLYVATRDVPAAAVSTPYMVLPTPDGPPLARPIPTKNSDFRYGAWLDETEVAWLEKLGIQLRASQPSR